MRNTPLPAEYRIRKKTIAPERTNKNTILNSNGPLTGSHGRHVDSSSAAIGRGHCLELECVDPTVWRTANYVVFTFQVQIAWQLLRWNRHSAVIAQLKLRN